MVAHSSSQTIHRGGVGSHGDTDFESKYSKLLTPLKELADNWNIDISAELEEYLHDLSSVTFTFDGSGKKFSFAEAALVIQGSAVVYSKKVEYLYSFIYLTLEHLQSKRKKHNSSIDSQGNDRDAKSFFKQDNIHSDFFEDIEGVLEESNNIDLDDQLETINTFTDDDDHHQQQQQRRSQQDYDYDFGDDDDLKTGNDHTKLSQKKYQRKKNLDYDPSQLKAYHTILMNETPSTNSSNSASDFMAKESSVGTGNPNDAMTSKSTFMMNKSRVTKDGALSLGVSLGSDLDDFDSLTGQITDRARNKRKQSVEEDDQMKVDIGITPDIAERNNNEFSSIGGDDLIDNVIMDTHIGGGPGDLQSDSDNDQYGGSEDYDDSDREDHTNDKQEQPELDKKKEMETSNKTKKNKQDKEMEKEIEKLKLKIKPITNPWLLLDPHEESTDEKPFKRGKPYSIPAALRKGSDLSKATEKRGEGLQFKSGELITFPTGSIALRGSYFKELNYLYQKNINQSRGVRLALIHQAERALRQDAVGTNDESIVDHDNIGNSEGGIFEEDLGSNYNDGQGEEEDDYIYNNIGGGDLDSDSDGEGINYSQNDIGGDIPSYNFNSISKSLNDEDDEFNSRTYDTQFSSDSFEKSYEEMCKEYISTYLDSAKQLLQETALMQRLNKWNSKIIPLLEEQSSHPPFDIQSYGVSIVSRVSSLFKDRCQIDQKESLNDKIIKEKNEELEKDSLISFQDLVGREPTTYEICRKFASCLQLANNGNLEIVSDRTMDNLSFHLLSTTPRHSRDITDFNAPINDDEDEDEDKIRVTKKKSSSSSSSKNRPDTKLDSDSKSKSQKPKKSKSTSKEKE